MVQRVRRSHRFWWPTILLSLSVAAALSCNEILDIYDVGILPHAAGGTGGQGGEGGQGTGGEGGQGTGGEGGQGTGGEGGCSSVDCITPGDVFVIVSKQNTELVFVATIGQGGGGAGGGWPSLTDMQALAHADWITPSCTPSVQFGPLQYNSNKYEWAASADFTLAGDARSSCQSAPVQNLIFELSNFISATHVICGFVRGTIAGNHLGWDPKSTFTMSPIADRYDSATFPLSPLPPKNCNNDQATGPEPSACGGGGTGGCGGGT